MVLNVRVVLYILVVMVYEILKILIFEIGLLCLFLNFVVKLYFDKIGLEIG